MDDRALRRITKRKVPRRAIEVLGVHHSRFRKPRLGSSVAHGHNPGEDQRKERREENYSTPQTFVMKCAGKSPFPLCPLMRHSVLNNFKEAGREGRREETEETEEVDG